MSQERMQSVKEGEVESELRGIKMDSQKQGVDQTPLMQQPSDAQRFTNIGGSTGQQTSSLQQQQAGQIPLTSQQPQHLSTGQQLSQQASSIPQQQLQQQPLGIQQPVQQQQQPQQIGSQYGQQGLQQSGTQPLQQVGNVQQQQQLQQQTPSGPSYATYEDIVIQDPAYEPVLRIANMQDAQRIAFLQPYRLVKFDGQFIQRSDKAGSLVPLSNAVAARIVCFPIPFAPQPSSTQDEHLGVMGGDKLAAGSTTTQQQQQQQQMPLSTSGQQVPLQPQQQQPLSQQVQQQHTLPPTLGQTAVTSTQQQQQQPQQFRSSGPAAAGITQVQQYRNTSVVNTMGLEIQMTSQVWELVPQDANEIVPGFWEKAKNPTIKSPLSLGRLLFLNTSHIESSSSRTSAPWIEKPARHTIVFGPTSDAPVLIVERDLKFVRKCIRVFDSDLRTFCKIEGTTSFLRKKIVITGPDEDTPIYTIKSKGYSGPFKGLSSIGGTSPDEPNFIIYQNKRAVGCITSRYIPNNTLPGQMISTTQNENMAYDVFFPYGSSWAPRAALLIAALFFDYLWSDKGE